MRLATDTITLKIGATPVELRASLRAATILADRHGDFATVLKGVTEGNATIIGDVLTYGVERNAAECFYGDVDRRGAGKAFAGIIGPLTSFVLALVGHDDDTKAEPTGKPIPFAEYHRQLFKIATGWLGWSADAAWQASPAEILAAYEGRIEMLKAVFGGGDDDDQPEPPTAVDLKPGELHPDFDRAGLRALAASFSNAR